MATNQWKLQVRFRFPLVFFEVRLCLTKHPKLFLLFPKLDIPVACLTALLTVSGALFLPLKPFPCALKVFHLQLGPPRLSRTLQHNILSW